MINAQNMEYIKQMNRNEYKQPNTQHISNICLYTYTPSWDMITWLTFCLNSKIWRHLWRGSHLNLKHCVSSSWYGLLYAQINYRNI